MEIYSLILIFTFHSLGKEVRANMIIKITAYDNFNDGELSKRWFTSPTLLFHTNVEKKLLEIFFFTNWWNLGNE